jgi:hypothetical protein
MVSFGYNTSAMAQRYSASTTSVLHARSLFQLAVFVGAFLWFIRRWQCASSIPTRTVAFSGEPK